MEVLDNKCPSCGSNIKFNPVTQKWDCEYCGKSYTEEAFGNPYNEIEKNDIDSNDDKINIDEYICKNCGAKIVTDENTIATHCVYCGNTAIIKNRIQGDYKPDKIIPFKVEKKEAIETFKKLIKRKAFAPNVFLMDENIEDVVGIYIPFWLYDCHVTGDITAKCTKVTSWSDSKYDYTNKKIYSCYREGSIDIIDLPVDSSSKFDDNVMDAIEPYDYNAFKKFNKSYLSGFYAEKYDLLEDEVYDRAKNRISNTFLEKLKLTLDDYNYIDIKKKNINIEKSEIEYGLLPVWLLNIKYNMKTYTFAMNRPNKKICWKSSNRFWKINIKGNKNICNYKYYIGYYFENR